MSGAFIGKNLFDRWFVNGIQLITKLKSNMKEHDVIFGKLFFSKHSMRNSKIWHKWNIILPYFANSDLRFKA